MTARAVQEKRIPWMIVDCLGQTDDCTSGGGESHHPLDDCRPDLVDWGLMIVDCIR